MYITNSKMMNINKVVISRMGRTPHNNIFKLK